MLKRAKVELCQTHAEKASFYLNTSGFIWQIREYSAQTESRIFEEASKKAFNEEMRILQWRTVQRRAVSTLRSTASLPNHTIPTLRQSPPSSSSPPPTFPFLNPDAVPPKPTLEESSPAGKVYKLTWPKNPRNILVVKKRNDERVKEAAITFARWEFLSVG